MAAKKLYRSREDAMIGGVCAGLAEYFNIDPTLVRLATVILVFPGGLSIWAYIIAWIIIPQKPLQVNLEEESTQNAGYNANVESHSIGGQTGEPVAEEQDKSRYIVGIVLVVLGILFLLNAFDLFIWFSFAKLWPAVLIIVGIAILYKAMNKGGEKNES